MPETLTTLSIFLGSPGDLPDERAAVQAAVDEVNETHARRRGYRLELLRWEDSVPGFGRAQARLNQLVEKADVFLGLLFRRWGTPPSKEGPYTSGFEEEFRISLQRRRAGPRPEIIVLFKNVDPASMADPGVELSRVLEFRQELIDSHEIQFADFGSSIELERLSRKYLSSIIDAQSTFSHEPRLEPISEDTRAASNSEGAVDVFSPQSKEFLKKLSNSTFDVLKGEVIPAYDVARLRLIALEKGSPGNDKEVLGVHDANLLYVHRADADLGDDEVRGLVDAGLYYAASHGVPFWYWHQQWSGSDDGRLSMLSILANDVRQRSGAILQMRLANMQLATSDGFDRPFYLSQWLQEREDGLAHEALRYLGEHGIESDCDVIAAHTGGKDSQTLNLAAEAIVRIKERALGAKAAADQLLQLQPTDVPAVLADRIVSNGLGRPGASRGLNHTAPTVRAAAVASIKFDERGPAIIAPLLEDPDLRVRKATALRLASSTYPISIDEIRRALVKPRQTRNALLPIFRGAVPDPATSEAMDEVVTAWLSKRSASELRAMCQGDKPNFNALFELSRRDLPRSAPFLRLVVDGRHDDDITEDWLSEELSLDLLNAVGIKEFRWDALNVLLSLHDPMDLSRARAGLGEVDRNHAVLFSYVGAHGDKTDIKRICESFSRRRSGLMMIDRTAPSEYEAAAISILSIYRRFSDYVFDEVANSDVLARVITLLTKAEFSGLDDDDLRDLLTNNADSIRVLTSARVVSEFTKKRILGVHKNYISQSKRYYNVVSILDIGISLPRTLASTVATNILELRKGRF